MPTVVEKREPVGAADEAAPALGAIVEVVEDVLEYPGQGAALLSEMRRLVLPEGGGVEGQTPYFRPEPPAPEKKTLQ